MEPTGDGIGRATDRGEVMALEQPHGVIEGESSAGHDIVEDGRDRCCHVVMG
jgi:hypothetical protein